MSANEQSQAVERALRTYEMYGGALRYLEKDKWHLCDRQAMQKVLDEFASALRPPQPEELRRLCNQAEAYSAYLRLTNETEHDDEIEAAATTIDKMRSTLLSTSAGGAGERP